jgi:hypothetical protein
MGTKTALLGGLGAVVVAGVVLAWADQPPAPASQPADAQKDLLAKADAIAAKVSATRGLKVVRKIERGVMAKDQIRARILARVDQEYAPGDLAAEELAMKRMGMLPADADYKKIVIDLLTDQIAGFYDPWERRLYIANWNTTGLAMMDDAVMAHEIDHALQDQHFNLRTFMTAEAKNADATSARQALVEGDGMALMLEYVLTAAQPAGSKMDVAALMWANDAAVRQMKQMAALNLGSLGNAPLILREGLMFPYLGGLEFVAHVRKTQPWKGVDAVFKKPPLSTEHIMHPAVYDAYERPDVISPAGAPPAALAGWKQSYQNVTGELGLGLFLRQHGVPSSAGGGGIGSTPSAPGKAELAATGWGGDRLVVFTPPAAPGAAAPKVADCVAVQYTAWDSEADAIEYFDALADALPSLSGIKASTRHEQTYLEHTGNGRTFAAERKGDAVVLVVGAPADKALDLRTQVWSGWKLKRN